MADKDDKFDTLFGSETVDAFVPFLGSQEKVARRIKERLGGGSEFPTINTIEEFNNLSSGDEYIDSETGLKGVKP